MLSTQGKYILLHLKNTIKQVPKTENQWTSILIFSPKIQATFTRTI